MSHSFTSDAKRLAGMTCRSLGWRPDDFWQATPAELGAILTVESAATEPNLSRSEMKALMELDGDG